MFIKISQSCNSNQSLFRAGVSSWTLSSSWWKNKHHVLQHYETSDEELVKSFHFGRWICFWFLHHAPKHPKWQFWKPNQGNCKGINILMKILSHTLNIINHMKLSACIVISHMVNFLDSNHGTWGIRIQWYVWWKIWQYALHPCLQLCVTGFTCNCWKVRIPFRSYQFILTYTV